jgi:exodeoxyribonuclease VII small subunit
MALRKALCIAGSLSKGPSMTEKQHKKKNSDYTTVNDESTPITFESSLAELEKTIEQLEDGDLTLDTSLELFEKGITLIRTCDTHLKKAQGKITELLKGENGEYVEKILGSSLESFVSKEDRDA